MDCTRDSHCSDGQTCNNNVCTCSQDSECTNTQRCQNGKCQEASCDTVSCGSNAACEVYNNDSACKCNSGYYSVTTPEDGCGELNFPSLSKFLPENFQFMSTKYETFEFQLIVLKILTAAMATHAVAICVHAVKIPIVQTHKPVKMENAKKYPATL